MSELRESDYQAAIDRENAKPDAMMRDQGLIAWAQSNIDDMRNPAAKIAREAFEKHQQANCKPTEKAPLPQMQAYLDRCVARCQKNTPAELRTKVKASHIPGGSIKK